MELSVAGPVWHWRGPSSYHFVTVPEAESALSQASAALVTYGWGWSP